MYVRAYIKHKLFLWALKSFTLTKRHVRGVAGWCESERISKPNNYAQTKLYKIYVKLVKNGKYLK